MALSKEVTSAVQLVVALLAFSMIGPMLFSGMTGSLRVVLERVGEARGRGFELSAVAEQLISAMGVPALAFGLMTMTAAVFAVLFQTRFLWSTANMGFKLSNLDPIKRLKQVFGPKKIAVRTLLAVAKVGVTGTVIWLLVRDALPVIATLSRSSLAATRLLATKHLWNMLLASTGVILVMAAIDYIWQRRQFMQRLKLPRSEQKREMEEQEGKPEVKGRRRQMHRQLSMNRIIESVPQADVVITNPTRLAIAVRYRPGKDTAPLVTAKGADSLAAIIRAIAREHGVAVIENRSLARTLWRRVRVGKEIPTDLYQDVARILVQVYQSRGGVKRVS